MNKGFWATIKKPIMVLAPMADVTDAAFRRIIAKYGKPDVLYTEFVSADGILSPGRDVLMRDLIYTEDERPIIAQFFTSNPENMEKVAQMAKEMGFDGFDINMGCPDRSVEKQGCGSALIKNPSQALELIAAAKRGAGEMPVSVKTRIGYNTDQTEEWIGTLLSAEPAVIFLHGRTRKEMSKVPAHWDAIARAVKVRDEAGSETLIIGNGDVQNLEEARQRVEETGVDGVMIGRGIFGNPWLFGEYELTSIEEKLRVMVEHTKLFEELLGDVKNFAIMKKHYKAYVNGFDGAKELRMELMEAQNAGEVEATVETFLLNLPRTEEFL